MVHRISCQLESVHPKMDVGRRNSGPLVAIEKRVALDKTLEQGSRLGNRVFVVTRLGSKHRCLKCTKIANTVGTTKLVDEDGVDCEHVDNAEVFAQLPGQLLVELAMPSDGRLQMSDDLRSGGFTLLLGHPLG